MRSGRYNKAMSVAIIHHVAGNTLGNLEGVLSRKQIPFHYLNCHELQKEHLLLTGIQGLIILGGKESVTEDHRYPFMGLEQQLIRNALQSNLPVFGICLGSQMLARSLGADIKRNQVNGIDTKERGWHPLILTEAGKTDPVLKQMNGVKQFQWHEDTFHLPLHSRLLAQSELCPRQAYRIDKVGAPVYGVQFHPEITPNVIQQWIDESSSLSNAQKQSLLDETQQHFSAYEAASIQLFEAFCDRAF
jgi:GMP synthase (glutamine-hydrolysing)